MSLFCQWLLAVVGLLAYVNSFQGAFLLDDQITILENEHIRSLSLPWEFWDNVRRPVFFLTVALNYAAGKDNPFGYHLFNLLVHLAAAQVLFLIVARTAALVKPGVNEIHRRWFAFFVAAFWEVHPLQTQSVTYITQRAESLMGLFFLLGLYGAIRYWRERNPLWALAAGAAALLSVLSKEVGVTLPVIALLYDRVFVSGSFRLALNKNRFLYAVLAVSWVVVGYFLLTVHPEEVVPSAGFHSPKIDTGKYLATQPEVILHYMRLVIWPRPLVFDYAWPAVESWRAAWPSSAIVIGSFLLALRALKAAPLWGFLGLSFFIVLAPSSSFIPLNDLAFEHRMYLPSVFVILLIMLGLRSIFKQLPALIPGIKAAAGFFVLILLIVLTVERNRDYVSGMTMWQDVVQKRPFNARALNNLATYLFMSGKKVEALPLYRRSLALNPDARAHTDFGQYLYEQGQPAEAKKYYNQALRYDPNYADAYLNLGVALAAEGKSEEALRQYSTVIRLEPDYGAAYNNIGAILANQGKYREAIPYYEKAIAAGFREYGVYHNLGIALAMNGRYSEALRYIREALRINPNSEQARQHIAEIEKNMRKSSTAGTGREIFSP